MFDLFLSTAIFTTQSQIVAQAQAATVYLPVSTKSSSIQNCVAYTTTNTTGRTVKDVSVNRRDSKGNISKSFLTSSLAAGKTETFSICDNSFVNVEAKQ